MIFLNTENSKIDESHRFSLSLDQRLDLKNRINMLLFKICVFITRGKI